MVYSFARVSAGATLRVEDYFEHGKRAWLRLHEKGGKRHEVPCHHNLAAYLDAWIDAAGAGGGDRSCDVQLGNPLTSLRTATFSRNCRGLLSIRHHPRPSFFRPAPKPASAASLHSEKPLLVPHPACGSLQPRANHDRELCRQTSRVRESTQSLQARVHPGRRASLACKF